MYRNDFQKQADPVGAFHGDVGLVRIKALPLGSKRIKGKQIALGEMTGHHHVLDCPGVKLYEAPLGKVAQVADENFDEARLQKLFGADVKLTIAVVPETKTAPLRHQEHGTIEIQPGTYWVTRQFEFPLGEPRRVQD